MPFQVERRTPAAISMSTVGRLENYTGTRFDFRVERTVRVIDRVTLTAQLGVSLANVSTVSYESINTLVNTGDATKR